MIISTIDKTVKTAKHENHFNYTYRYYSDGEIEFTWFKNLQLFGRNGGRKLMSEGKTEISEERKELYRYQARIRAGSTIRQLVKENNLNYMWTLTYAAEVTSRDIVLDDFKKFIMRLNYQTGEKIPYVAVTEVQKARLRKTGTAVLHFHMAIDRYIAIDIMKKSWKHGFVFVSTYESGKKIEGKNDISSYLSKYLKKEMEENPQSEGKKMYLNSHGLSRPDKGHGVITEDEKAEITTLADNYEINEEISCSRINPKKLLIKAAKQQEAQQYEELTA